MASFSGNCFVLEFCIFITGFLLSGICHARFYPASFIFGDSLVDAGNNNFILTLSKANFPPNGIDLGRVTGRYTNGRTIPDIVGQALGETVFSPPYLDPTTTGDAVLHGVNYGSGAGGILNFTGKFFGGRINLDAQLDNFANTRQDLISNLGMEEALDILHNSVFSVTMGANDFINNYLFPIKIFSQRTVITADDFVEEVLFKFKLQLTRLYRLDARKVVVVNVGPIGCIPYLREIFPTSDGSCPAFPNELVQSFNKRLRDDFDELTANFEGATFVYGDVYHIVADIIENYSSYGFEVADSACCSVAGKYGGLLPCGPSSKVCLDRTAYVFWDPYHPSDATNQIIAKRLLDGGREDIYPINLRTLAFL